MTWQFADFIDLLGIGRYTARNVCLASDPMLIGLSGLSDGALGVCYILLGVLFYLCYLDKRRTMNIALTVLSDNVFLKLLGFTFIFGGVSYLASLWTLFQGVYYLETFLHMVSTGITLATTVRVFRVVYGTVRYPKAFREAMTAEVPTYDLGNNSRPPASAG